MVIIYYYIYIRLGIIVSSLDKVPIQVTNLYIFSTN